MSSLGTIEQHSSGRERRKEKLMKKWSREIRDSSIIYVTRENYLRCHRNWWFPVTLQMEAEEFVASASHFHVLDSKSKLGNVLWHFMGITIV